MGARPFRRPPHTGFFDVAYTRNKLNLMFKGAMASRADDSTYLSGLDSAGETSSASQSESGLGIRQAGSRGTYACGRVCPSSRRQNLLNNQHIGPSVTRGCR